MTVPITVNGVTFLFPTPGDRNWGAQATAAIVALSTGTLQKTGGAFALTNAVDFGADFGLRSVYLESRSANRAAAGVLRLANSDLLSWRNAANTADLGLGVSSDQLVFNGQRISLPTIDSGFALQSGVAGFPEASSVTAAELGRLSGVTSPIQSQIDNKLAVTGGSLVGPLLLSTSPTTNLQAATKQYVDTVAGLGIRMKDAVRVATTANGTLASAFANGQTVDGVTLATGNRILIKNQSVPAENGIYTVNASGAPTRATDADTFDENINAFVFVTAGTVNANSQWLSSTNPGGTLGTSPITFAQFSGAVSFSTDGQGIEIGGSVLSLELDGSSLSKSASGLRVANSGISNAQVAADAAIARTKIASGNAFRVLGTNENGQIVDLGAIATNRVLVSDPTLGLPVASSITTTTLGFLDITSSLTGLLNTRLSTAGGSLTGPLNMNSQQINNIAAVPSADGSVIGRRHGFGGNSVMVMSLSDDAVCRIDGIGSSSTIIVQTRPFSGDNRGLCGAIRMQSGIGTANAFAGELFSHFAASDTPPAAGSSGGVDGMINFQCDATDSPARLWIKNRVGSTISIRLYFIVADYPNATIISTNL